MKRDFSGSVLDGEMIYGELNKESKERETFAVEQESAVDKKISEAQRLKNIWNRGLLYEKKGVKNTEEVDEIMQLSDIGRKLLDSKFYVTDTIAASSREKNSQKEKDPRRIQSGEEINGRSKFIINEMRKFSSDKENGNDIENLLNEYLGFIKNKTVYTRDGLEAIADLINDNFLTAHIIEQRAARLAINDLSEDEGWKKILSKYPLHISEGDVAESLGIWLTELPEELREKATLVYQKKEAVVFQNFAELVSTVETINDSNQFESLSGDKQLKDLPLEIQLMVKEHPEIAGDIVKLIESKADVRFKTRTQTPSDVVEAIHKISALTQHNYQINWLKDFILRGQKPKLTLGSDIREQISEIKNRIQELDEQIETLEQLLNSESDIQEKKSLETKLKNIKGKKERLSEDLSGKDGSDLESKLELIQSSINGYKEIIALQPEELTAEENNTVKKINDYLDHINKEYAAIKIQFDTSDEQTSAAQKIVKAMMMIGPVAHGMEHLDLGTMAKLFASSSDDLLGEWAEIKALQGAGFSTKDILKRMKIAAPVFGAATYGATKVEGLLHDGRELAAGALFGITAVALSLTTALQSMRMYKKNYEALVKEGKIKGTSFLSSNPQFREKWDEFSSDIEKLDKGGLIVLVEKVLKKLNLQESGMLTEEEQKQLLEDLEALDEKEIEKLLTRNINLEAWRKAIIQDFNNPVRLGILLGSASAPVAGMAGGAAGLLHNGFILAGIGSTESIVGGLTVIGAKRLSEFKWKLSLKEKLEAKWPVPHILRT